MCSLSFAARVRISNKSPVEEWVECAVNRMMQEPVANGRFMNVARLRIGNFECLIPAVAVDMVDNIIMKLYDIIHQMDTEFLNIWFRSFSRKEFLPCGEQILKGGNGLEFFFELYFHGKYK